MEHLMNKADALFPKLVPLLDPAIVDRHAVQSLFADASGTTVCADPGEIGSSLDQLDPRLSNLPNIKFKVGDAVGMYSEPQRIMVFSGRVGRMKYIVSYQ